MNGLVTGALYWSFVVIHLGDWPMCCDEIDLVKGPFGRVVNRTNQHLQYVRLLACSVYFIDLTRKFSR